MGFLNAVYPAESFETEVMRIAKSMASGVSPAAMKLAKRQIYADLLSHDAGGALEHSKVLIGQQMKHADYAEALAAMKEKRAPNFGDPGSGS